MLFLELLQQVELLLLVARGLSGLLLALIKHHLLDHAARLAVEVTQLAVLGLDLGGVDFGGGGDDVRPPLELVDLVEMDGDLLLRCWGSGDSGKGPGAVVDVDGVGEVALGVAG